MLIDRLLPYATSVTFAEGASIYQSHQEVSTLYYLKSGRVKIYIDHFNGKRGVLDFIGPEDWLGELSLFRPEMVLKGNTVLTPVQAYAFELSAIQNLVREDVAISNGFADYLAQVILKRSYRLSEFMNYPLRNQLARFILMYSDQQYYRIKHADAAEYLNISYRHLLYQLQDFCARGILVKEKGYRIVNRKALHAFVEEMGV